MNTRKIIKNFPSPIAIERDGQIMALSEALVSLLALDPLHCLKGELSLQSILTIETQRMLSRRQKRIQSGRPYSPRIIGEAIRSDKTIFPVEIILEMVDFEGTEATRYLFFDLTEQSELQRKGRNSMELLQMISRMQSLFIEDISAHELFSEVLTRLLEVTGSEFGFLGEILVDGTGELQLISHGLNIFAGQAQEGVPCQDNPCSKMDFRNPRTLIGQVISNGQTVISNSPASDPCQGCAFRKHSGLNSFMGVPLYYGGQLMGMFGLANRPGGYDDDMETFLGPLLKTSGQIIGAYRNLRLKKEADKALQESEHRFHNLFSQAADAIFVHDFQGKIIDVNASACQSLGYSREELITLNLAEIERTFSRNIIGKWQEISAHRSLSYEGLHQRKSGEMFSVEVVSSLIETSNERHILSICRDISERKKMERMKNEFVSTVNHELRTPLTSIYSALNLISDGLAGELPPEAVSLMNIALKNSARLVDLINDILDVEQMESGQMPMYMRKVNLESFLAQSLAKIREYAEKFSVETELGRIPGEVIIKADSHRLMKVMTNLLSNAIKYSRPRSKVTVKTELMEKGVRISVVDRGQGVPEHFRPRLFEKFSQADSSDSRQQGGTGLGLSIVKSIVEAHGGSIGYETREGEGSTFYFDLEQWQPPSWKRDSGQPVRRRQRALVCSETGESGLMLCDFLESNGFDTDSVLDIQESGLRLKHNEYDAFIIEKVLTARDIDRLDLIFSRYDKSRRLALLALIDESFMKPSLVQRAPENIKPECILKPANETEVLSSLRRLIRKAQGRKLNIIHIEDDSDVLQVVSFLLHDIAQVHEASSLKQAFSMLEQEEFDLAIIDPGLGPEDGLELLPMLKKKPGPQTPVIVYTANDLKTDVLAQVERVLVKTHTTNQELLDAVMDLA
ncbi:MAG: ATP-binding protein [Deltaproteobacteria bacterium]|nr:ATP-binding protein [Deltaproteobacteria bacterium]